jgi:integrase
MPPRLQQLPKGIPSKLTLGGLVFRIFATKQGMLGFRFKSGSQWRQILRKDIADLRREAERIGLSILNADTTALDMTAEKRRIALAAEEILAPHGLALDAAARLIAEAARHAGGVHAILDACRFHGKSDRTLASASTADVVAHFIRHLSCDGVSDLYLRPMEADLAKFAAKFPGQLALVRTAEMEDWLRDMPIGLRRRRNLRDKLVAVYNFARDNKYLPTGLRTEAEMIRRPKVPRKAPALFTPDEMDLLLTQCVQPANAKIGRHDYADFLPCIAIAGFAGLRWAEIQSLDWSHVHWTDAVIEVGEENKTGYRLVPMLPNLMTWLAPYRETAHGPVCTVKRPDHVVRRIGLRAGLPMGGRRYANAFRKSFVTYRVAATKNMPQVSGETGHSVAELRKSYNRASLDAVARKWFGIVRDAANVVQMPLLSMRRQG